MNMISIEPWHGVAKIADTTGRPNMRKVEVDVRALRDERHMERQQ
ncbi:hypothetical protein [Devosia riboflavina]|nr:hypothetical protein [Devosia riboflavina]